MITRLAPALLAVVVAAVTAAAQPGPGVIAGTVVSDPDGAPIISATVTITRMADSTVVDAVLTAAGGRFARPGLPAGQYRVEIASVGRATYTRPNITLTTDSPRQELGTIGLAASAVQLEGVAVEAERSQVVLAADRSIYNIREMPLAQGGVATDALRAIPELDVDVDDNIRARGGTPPVFLDGRPVAMQGEALTAFLRTLRADRIDRIEYIPNPSARFEADGQSGIVNIVLRRDAALGLSGSVAASAGTRGTQNLSTRINYQTGPLTFFGGALLGFNQGGFEYLGFRENLAAEPRTFLQHEFAQDQSGVGGGGDLTAEWKLTPRSTGWSIIRANYGDVDLSSNGEFIFYDAARSPYEWHRRSLDRDTRNRNVSGALG